MPSPSERQARRRVRFEHNASRVVFDPEARQFVVSWSKCDLSAEDRLLARRDPLKWIPSVSAVMTLYGRGCVAPDQTVPVALAVGRAWDAGDRDGLDTEEAKKAAEFVRGLAEMYAGSSSPSVCRDVGHALLHLLDEIATVRFMNASLTDEDADRTLRCLGNASLECFAEPDFANWSGRAMRRRFLYCLGRRERTDVAYTLLALLFDTGFCPLLSLSDRRTLRMHCIAASGLDREFGHGAVVEFFRFALDKMRDMKANGRSALGMKLTQQQFADSLLASDESSAKTSNNQTKGMESCNS